MPTNKKVEEKDVHATPEVAAQRNEKTEAVDGANPGLGERLATEAAEKNADNSSLEGVKGKDGGFSVVSTPHEDKSDNGKTYNDERINPRDTNAPDAGLTPDGRRIAS